MTTTTTSFPITASRIGHSVGLAILIPSKITSIVLFSLRWSLGASVTTVALLITKASVNSRPRHAKSRHIPDLTGDPAPVFLLGTLLKHGVSFNSQLSNNSHLAQVSFLVAVGTDDLLWLGTFLSPCQLCPTMPFVAPGLPLPCDLQLRSFGRLEPACWDSPMATRSVSRLSIKMETSPWQCAPQIRRSCKRDLSFPGPEYSHEHDDLLHCKCGT